MVSTAIEMAEAELIRELKRIKREHAKDPEYKEFRKAFPKAWPI
jgi:hypothetical protein